MQLFKNFLLLASISLYAVDTLPPEASVYTEQETLLPQKPEISPPPIAPVYKSPTAAVCLSILWPGLGHVYLGDLKTASGFFVSSGISLSSMRANEKVSENSGIMLQNTWFYGIFAAYRDARIFNNEAGYRYKVPTDTLADLSFAPFRWRVVKKPEVWGGVIGSLALATGVGYLMLPKNGESMADSISENEKLSPILAFPVGIGEEAFFRGCVQSSLAETFTPWGGIAITSALFAAAHIPNAQLLKPEHRWRYYTYVIPFISTLGVYKGWLAYKNHSLQESVAVHSWYDFTLFLLQSLATTSVVGKPSFSTTLKF